MSKKRLTDNEKINEWLGSGRGRMSHTLRGFSKVKEKVQPTNTNLNIIYASKTYVLGVGSTRSFIDREINSLLKEIPEENDHKKHLTRLLERIRKEQVPVISSINSKKLKMRVCVIDAKNDLHPLNVMCEILMPCNFGFSCPRAKIHVHNNNSEDNSCDCVLQWMLWPENLIKPSTEIGPTLGYHDIRPVGKMVTQPR